MNNDFISCGDNVCIINTGKFKRGELCSNYQGPFGVFHVGTKDTNVYGTTIIRQEFDRCFRTLNDFIFIDLYKETIEKKLFFKAKTVRTIENCYFSFSQFDQVYLERVQSEILLYILEIEDKELLIQFSTDIKYTLDSLIDLYKQRDSIDYAAEITKVSSVFKEINAYCMPLQFKANLQADTFKNEKIIPSMNAHTLAIDSTIARVKELNKYKDIINK
ncbi:hypothetical protein [Clostridium estertheticum]|uniref:hypothetical protein n=1 Tax=Clostridium estertheticum TaxID=238834 RepID=UPI001C0DEBA9|nr:hypothetical protein [Clostridium estertheticum]MBU3173255.1 hypothetical protein [Clostridium estertheticum]